jgi:hypothetical protein
MDPNHQTTGSDGNGEESQMSSESHTCNDDSTRYAMQQLTQAEKMADQLESRLDTFLGDLERFLSTSKPMDSTTLQETSTKQIANGKTQ